MKPARVKSKEKKLKERSVQNRQLIAGYTEMAHDRQQESEALEWCEALIGDGIRERRACDTPAHTTAARLRKQFGHTRCNI